MFGISMYSVFKCLEFGPPLLFVNSNVFRQSYGNVNRWFSTVVNQPQVKKIVGAVTLCEKMAQFDAKKYAEFQASVGAAPAKKAEKKPEEKKAPAPKKEKPKKEDDDEEGFNVSSYPYFLP